MSQIITASGLTKHYGDVAALDDVNFKIERGNIVGLLGPNGAGKTTALKALLGLTRFHGELDVLGLNPFKQRSQLMQRVCFIADVAILPRWLRVSQAVDFVEGVHPCFNRQRAESFLARTNIPKRKRIGKLSKGMVTQLHLALVMAIDVELLILDEPTLGLDILYRKQFYETLLNDYFDEQRTIIIATHQVEEVEHILTDLMFINKGRIVLSESMPGIEGKYTELLVAPAQVEAARALGALYEREVLGKHLFLFQDVARDKLRSLGELHRPSVADLFVAKMHGEAA